MREESIQEYGNIITFIKELERLKVNTRTAWTKGGRQESIAEHSWRLSVFALALQDHFPGIDMNRLICMCLIHDLGEAYEGDISATIEMDPENKLEKEEQAVRTLFAPLSESMQTKLLALWWEYNRGETKEAKIAKAIDKLETIIQHNQGDNPAGFDYAFNLGYGRAYALHDPVLKSLRDLIDKETLDNVDGQKSQGQFL